LDFVETLGSVKGFLSSLGSRPRRDRWGRAVVRISLLGISLMKVEKERSLLLKSFFREFVKAKGSRLKDKGQWENASLAVVMLFL
jgi:hypothetical protein